MNLAPYHFYMKVATEDSEEAFSGQTVPLDIEESEKVQKTVVANSRKKYATPKATVEQHLNVLFGQESKGPDNEATSKRAKQTTPTRKPSIKNPKNKRSGEVHEG